AAAHRPHLTSFPTRRSSDLGREYVPPEEAYPWFFALDDDDRKGIVNYSEELDCLHEDLDFALIDLERAQEDSYSDRLMKVDASRSEEHTSELQSLAYLVCRL